MVMANIMVLMEIIINIMVPLKAKDNIEAMVMKFKVMVEILFLNHITPYSKHSKDTFMVIMVIPSINFKMAIIKVMLVYC